MFLWRRIDHYDFPVKVVPLSSIVNEKYKVCMKNLRAIVRTDRNTVIAIVSKYYSFVPHRVVIENISSVLGKPQFIMLNPSGSRMYAFWKTEDRKVLDEKYSFGIMATNSYDGTKSISFSLFGLRQICSNGLYSELILKRAKIIHRGKKILERISSFVSLFPKVIDMYVYILEQLNNITVKKNDIENLLEYLSLTKTQKSLIRRELNFLRNEKYVFLDVFNSITYAITHLYRTKNIETRIMALKKLENYIADNFPRIISHTIPHSGTI